MLPIFHVCINNISRRNGSSYFVIWILWLALKSINDPTNTSHKTNAAILVFYAYWFCGWTMRLKALCKTKTRVTPKAYLIKKITRFKRNNNNKYLCRAQLLVHVDSTRIREVRKYIKKSLSYSFFWHSNVRTLLLNVKIKKYFCLDPYISISLTIKT